MAMFVRRAMAADPPLAPHPESVYGDTGEAFRDLMIATASVPRRCAARRRLRELDFPEDMVFHLVPNMTKPLTASPNPEGVPCGRHIENLSSKHRTIIRECGGPCFASVDDMLAAARRIIAADKTPPTRRNSIFGMRAWMRMSGADEEVIAATMRTVMLRLLDAEDVEKLAIPKRPRKKRARRKRPVAAEPDV